MDYIKDYITGKEIELTGTEENRQKVIKFLVEEKGFLKSEIKTRVPFEIKVLDETYKTELDLVIIINDKIAAAFKTPAGSLSSWERELVAGARILVPEYQIPLAIVSDGKKADIFDAIKGQKIASGMENIFSKKEMEKYLEKNPFVKFPEEKADRQKMVFKTYDSLNVNR
jgi:hypothetical protein